MPISILLFYILFLLLILYDISILYDFINRLLLTYKITFIIIHFILHLDKILIIFITYILIIIFILYFKAHLA